MDIPFTTEQFLDVFRRYNTEQWPARWVLLADGAVAAALALRGRRRESRLAALLLAFLWLWMGVVYHLGYFRAINPAAVYFGVAFIAQAVLFAWLGAWRGGLAFEGRADGAGILGGVLLAYALVGYPLLGLALGHRYPAAPTFGLPCPTTIFTFGLLLWARPPVPRALLVIPALWSVLGVSAAAQLGMREDLGLIVAALLATPVVLARGRVVHVRQPNLSRSAR
jgi:hypothetical protein